MKILHHDNPAKKLAGLMLFAWFLMLPVISCGENRLVQAKEKARVRMTLNYFKVSHDSCYLTVRVRTRQDRKYVPVQGVIINLFLNEQTKSGMMGNITTDQDGRGTFILPEKFYGALDTLNSFEFFARLKNDPAYVDNTTDLTIKDVIMSASFHDYDSLKEIEVSLVEKDGSGQGIPVESADIKFYVKRLFGLLPVGEDNNFTDEEGQVRINFPTDLPGGEGNNLEVIIRLEDDENFGNIIVNKTLAWGSDLLVKEDTFHQRTMWSSRSKTPWYLLVFPNLMLFAVWGIIIYLIMQLVKIYKVSKKQKQI